MFEKIIDRIYGLTYSEAKEQDVLLRNNLPSCFYAKSINYPNTVDLITYLNENGVGWDEETTSWKIIDDEIS